MKIKEIIKLSQRPKLYTKGTFVMWTDEHISKQLLEVHLNTEMDLASRKLSSIRKTVDWILEKANGEQLNILDLGCGPGLYTEIYAKKGHQVTGVDFSANSIRHAKTSAEKKNLPINYINQNYLTLEMEANQFDLVTLIYTDFGVLLPEERKQLLAFIKKVLKPGGTFIFDVLNDHSLDQKISPKNWEVADNGFWKNAPYLALSESFLYEKEKVVLSQHTVCDENDKVYVYRFWTHFFSDSDIEQEVKNGGFADCSLYKDVLPESDIWNGENVTFCVTEKM